MAGAEVMEEGEKAAKAEFKKKVEEMEWGGSTAPREAEGETNTDGSRTGGSSLSWGRHLLNVVSKL